jgi:hypothetical protein
VVVTGSALDRSHRSLNALTDAGVDSVVVPMSRRRILVGLAFLAAGFATLNVVACNHARAFLSFAPNGEKSPRPERLSLAEKLKVLVMGVSNPRPRKRFVVFAGAEHESLVKAHPGRWMSEVGAFVRGRMRTAVPETARR